MPRVEANVTSWGVDKFKLSIPFKQHFMRRLREVKAAHVVGPNFSAGDCVAFALYRSGREFGIDEQRPNHGHLRPRNGSRLGWSRLKLADSERVLRIELVVPESSDELRPSRGGHFSKQAELTMDVKFNPDSTGTPKITIQIQGEPVRLFWGVMDDSIEIQNFGAASPKVVKTWRSLLKWLSLLTGHERPTAGQPTDTIFEHAALWHHLRGLSIRKVAEKLCPLNHKHDSKCVERFRKGIERFWKKQRQAALALPRLR